MGREGRGVKNYGGLRDTAIMGKTNENFQMSPTVFSDANSQYGDRPVYS